VRASAISAAAFKRYDTNSLFQNLLLAGRGRVGTAARGHWGKIYNKFEGGVYDDDWVEIEQPRRRKPGQWLEVNKLTNLSSGALFTGRRFRF